MQDNLRIANEELAAAISDQEDYDQLHIFGANRVKQLASNISDFEKSYSERLRELIETFDIMFLQENLISFFSQEECRYLIEQIVQHLQILERTQVSQWEFEQQVITTVSECYEEALLRQKRSEQTYGEILREEQKQLSFREVEAEQAAEIEKLIRENEELQSTCNEQKKKIRGTDMVLKMLEKHLPEKKTEEQLRLEQKIKEQESIEQDHKFTMQSILENWNNLYDSKEEQK
ncbi:hypothetical protein FGO68_gene101 [Halteria grandinella]|uniref:Uncharacterized protein n=1 Tax=Halteria grandinella TaxID=5974 RepID=A0A8J8N9H8_HALGN|nr:hypothetical protein FGO68_gene101 [Halteria grandinella]